MDIGEKLFELRKAKNLSQEEVAEKLNVTRQTVSKWETNQSTPDFDKIIPICELFEISTEELLTGKKAEETEVVEKVEKEEVKDKPLTKEEARRKSAEVVSTSVFLYIFSVAALCVLIVVFRMNPVLATAIFLCIIGYATARIVKNYMSMPKFEKTKEEKRKDKIEDQIETIIFTTATVIYFLVSFITCAWHITWIIFILGSVASSIVKLICMLKEEDKDEE